MSGIRELTKCEPKAKPGRQRTAERDLFVALKQAAQARGLGVFGIIRLASRKKALAPSTRTFLLVAQRDKLEMTRQPVKFRQADISRAVKGAQAGGLDIGKIEIDGAGKIILFAKSEIETGSDLERWEQRRARAS